MPTILARRPFFVPFKGTLGDLHRPPPAERRNGASLDLSRHKGVQPLREARDLPIGPIGPGAGLQENAPTNSPVLGRMFNGSSFHTPTGMHA